MEAGRRAQANGGSPQDIVNAIRAVTGHLSRVMAKKYSKPREVKVQRAEAREWLKQWCENTGRQPLPYSSFMNEGLKWKFIDAQR